MCSSPSVIVHRVQGSSRESAVLSCEKILVLVTYVFKNVEVNRLLKLAPADVENLNVAAFREIVTGVALLNS